MSPLGSAATAPSSPSGIHPTQTTIAIPRLAPFLPNDIHLLIISLLTKSQLARCCRVSRAFYSIALHYLYADITINPKDPYSQTPHFGVSSEGLLHTTHLTIHRHMRKLCEALPPLILPNLATLRIGARNLTTCMASDPSLMASHDEAYDTRCPLLDNLHLHRLIIEWDAEVYGPPVGLATRSDPTFPPPGVEYLVVLFGPGAYFSRNHGNNRGYDLFGRIPASIKEVTLVIQTKGGAGQGLREWTTDFYQCAGMAEAEAVERVNQEICDVLASACVGKAVAVVIVGVERFALREFGKELSIEKKAEMIRARIMVRLIKDKWEKGEAEERVESVRFLSFEEYQGPVE